MLTRYLHNTIFVILAVIAVLTLLLVSCNTTSEEPTASLPTSPPLPTVTPTATTPAEPSPTETSPAATPAEPAEPGPLPEETVTVLDQTITMPEGAVIYFSQEGGFAGVMNSWVVYADGTIVNSSGQTSQVAAEEVDTALQAIEQSGFYDLDQPKPSDVCCDFFHYTLIVRDGTQSNAISLSEGEPDLPAAFSQSVAIMLGLVQNSYPSQ